jgi:hypothetical protein
MSCVFLVDLDSFCKRESGGSNEKELDRFRDDEIYSSWMWYAAIVYITYESKSLSLRY